MQCKKANFSWDRKSHQKKNTYNTKQHSPFHQTFSEMQQFTLKRPNLLPLQTETKFSAIPCACLWCSGNPSLWNPCPKSLVSQEISWPHLIAPAGTCKSSLANQLERHIYFKFSACCASAGSFILYYQHILRSLHKVNQQMTMLLKQLSPRHVEMPGITSMAGLKKEKEAWYLLQ